jgi:hypothetical protein
MTNTFSAYVLSNYIKIIFLIGAIFPFLTFILGSTGATSQSFPDDDYIVKLENSNPLLNSIPTMLSLGFAVGASGTSNLYPISNIINFQYFC